MANILQPSFGGGEYDPSLWGRQDLGRFGTSARTLKNFIVKPQGGIESRPGFVLIGEVKDSTRPVLLVDFQVSEDLAYVAVFNAGVIQFIYRGAFLVSGMTRVEVSHPYTDDQLSEINYTQSADTLYIAHPSQKIKLLKRTGSTTFVMSDFVPREGPFRSINSDTSLKLACSATTGNITVTSNFDLFTSNMVGALIFMEPEALGTVKPWTQGERTPNLAVGSVRRSDGKYYKATTVSVPSGTGAYCETGNVRPVHEIGKEWDGPADQRTFDTINYRVGVEWEYMHSGYGIAEITEYTNARSVKATVKKTFPSEVVGGVGTPANSWTMSGNGVTKTFSITGASTDSTQNYAVTIDGSPIQPDPNYTPPGGGGGGGGGSGGGGYVP